MSKRIYPLSLVTFIFLCIPYASAQPITVSIPNDLTATPQTSGLKIPVNVTDLTGLGVISANLTVSYDTNVLTATGMTLMDTIAEGSIAFDNADDAEGKISIALSRATPYIGSGVLLFVLFEVDSENINVSSTLSLTEAKLNAEAIPVETSDGGITLVTTPPADAVIISIPFLTITPNTTSVQVPVNTTSVTGMEVISASLVISYDTNVLSATGASFEGAISEGGGVETNIDDTKGEVALGMVRATPISGSGVLVNINFDVDSDVPGAKSSLIFKKSSLNGGKVLTVARSGDILLQIPGDACGPSGSPDGVVDIFDLVCLGLHWRETVDNTTASDELFILLDIAGRASFDEPDGVIDIYDLIVLADNFNVGTGAAPSIIASLPVETIPSLTIPSNANAFTLPPRDSICTTVDSEFDLSINIGGVYGLRGYSFEIMFDKNALEILKGSGSSVHTMSTPYFLEGDILKANTQGNPTFAISKLMTTHKPDDTLNANSIILGKGSSTSASGTLGEVRFKATSTGELKVALRNVILFTDTGVFTIPDVTYKVLVHKPITESRLLQNFPNPFNPETWIPYELHIDSDVKIKIYDIRGKLVRTLNIGHQPAGAYTSKTGAAHWDGRNQLGEKVANGAYLYQLDVGFDTPSATQPKGRYNFMRKMVILK